MTNAQHMNTTTPKAALKKQQRHAFKKDIYLLGIDNHGAKYWLEAPSWDCGWYWGFGYVETYTNNSNPEKAKDISMHTHIDSHFERNGKIQLWHSALDKHTFTGIEAKELSELFTDFYELKWQAAKLHDNDYNKNNISDLQTVEPSDDNHAVWLDMVTTQIPAVMNRIIEILKP